MIQVIHESSVKQMRHEYRTIQALRFIAAFAVVVLHSSFYAVERLGSNLGVYAIGANGVRLFFVISGFVMIVSSIGLLDRERGWSTFALKRIVRIVPMYWLITSIKLAALLLVPAVVLHAKLDWGYVAKSYFFIPAMNADGQLYPLLGVGWTLVFEMFFYFLFMVALFLRRSPLFVLTPVMLALAAAFFFRQQDWPIAAQFWCDPIVLDFLAGMYIAACSQSGKKVVSWVAAIFLLAGLIYLFVPFPRFHYQSFSGSITTTIAASMVVLGCVTLEARMAAWIPRIMLFLGATSYATYLIHPIISPVIPHAFAKLGFYEPHLSILLSVAAALVAGAAFHLYFEKPVTDFLNHRFKQHGWFSPSSTRSLA